MISVILLILGIIFGLIGLYYGKMAEKIHYEINPFLTKTEREIIEFRFNNISTTVYAISIILLFIMIIIELTKK